MFFKILNISLGTGTDGLVFYAVAVVLKANADINYNNLVGKKSCHTGKVSVLPFVD
jgi:hypothetical protein